MEGVIRTLNENAGVLNLLFGFLVAAATIFYAVLTARLVAETRRMRRAQTDPEVFVQVQPSEAWINLIELVVENAGAGPALDVHLTADPDFEYDKGRRLSQLGLFKHGVRLLGPRQSIKTFLLSVADRVQEVTDPNGPFRFQVTATYRNAAGIRLERRFELDLLHLVGMVQLGTPPLLTIAKSVESMKTDLEHVLSGFKKINVIAFTKDDTEREHEEALARYRELKAAQDPKPGEEAV